MKNIFIRHKTLLLPLAGALILSVILRRSFPLFLYLVGVTAIYLPLKGGLARSAVFRTVIAFIGILCLFQILAIIFWGLSVWASPLLYLLISLVIIGAAVLWAENNKKLEALNVSFKRLDVILLLPCLLIGGVYLAGTLSPAEKDTRTIIRSITYGMDDATHAVLFTDILDHGSNILAGDERNKLMHKSVNSSYPVGWHVSASIVAESMVGSKDRTPAQSIELYFYSKVFTLMLATFSVTALIYAIAYRLWPKFNNILRLLAITGLSLFVVAILLLPLFFEGFFSFIPIILYANLFAILLIDNKRRDGSIILLGLLSAASSLTWMLTGPIFVIAYALYCLNSYGGSLKKMPFGAYTGIALSGLFMLAQAYILYSANRSSIDNVAAEGGITSPDHLLLLVSIVAFFALYITNKKAQAEIAKPLMGFVTIYLAVLAVLLLYLTTMTSEITYYYIKLQMPILVILFTALCVYIFSFLLNTVRKAKLIDQTISLIAGFALLSLAIPSLIGYEYIYNTVNRAHAYMLSSGDATILESTLNEQSNNANERVVFMFPDQAPRNILASNIDKLRYRSTRCDYQLFAAVYAYDTTGLAKTLQKCTQQLPPVRIYTNEEGKKQIYKSLDLMLIDHKEVNIVVI